MSVKAGMCHGELFLAVLVTFCFVALPLRAATIEVESDDEDISAPSTPSPASSNQPAKNQAAPQVEEKAGTLAQSKPSSVPETLQAPKGKGSNALTATPVPMEIPQTFSSAASAASASSRVRISDNIGFYYFIKAGYVANPSSVPVIGKVVGTFGKEVNLNILQKFYIETTSDKIKLTPGDLLVVYRNELPVSESHSGSLGYLVENLAIAKVIEVQKRRCLVEAIKAFDLFKSGDKVEPYDVEIKRWKQVQIKKPLPTNSLKCYVAGGEPGSRNFQRTDVIYLSAGTKKGVVEGQTFQLREYTDLGLLKESIHSPQGKVQVIFAGPDASTAQILTCDELIQKGFEAVYQP